MVFFTCAGCGDSLKKSHVEKHRLRCRRSDHLTCIDCCKDFFNDEYNAHTKCISEDQKYGGANYVAKENKGEVKQEKWFEIVQMAIDRVSKSFGNNNRQLLKLLEGLRRYPNVPRKEAKFRNFAKSSFSFIDESVVLEAWAAIKAVSDEVNPPKPPPTPAKQETSNAQNGHSVDESEQNDKKRKKDSETENDSQETPPARKKSKKEKPDKLNSQENIPQEKSSTASEEKEGAEKSSAVVEEHPSTTVKLKSLVKKLLKRSENGELTLKRLKKYAGKETQCTNDEQKADLYSRIDEFLKKNTQKYATDGKIVRFACKS